MCGTGVAMYYVISVATSLLLLVMNGKRLPQTTSVADMICGGSGGTDWVKVWTGLDWLGEGFDHRKDIR